MGYVDLEIPYSFSTRQRCLNPKSPNTFSVSGACVVRFRDRRQAEASIGVCADWLWEKHGDMGKL